MKPEFKNFKVEDLFEVQSGDFHATSELDKGDVPLISCGDTDNGLVDYFEIPAEKRRRRSITVAYNGQPLTTKFHPYDFGTKDDVAVLVPRQPMTDAVLLLVAALLNRMQWRYSYGRKCFKEKLQDVVLKLPVVSANDAESIDEKFCEELFCQALKRATDGTQRSVENLFAESSLVRKVHKLKDDRK